MSPLEQGGLFHPEQGTGLSEAPPAAEETSGEDLGVFSVAAGFIGRERIGAPILSHSTPLRRHCLGKLSHEESRGLSPVATRRLAINTWERATYPVVRRAR